MDARLSVLRAVGPLAVEERLLDAVREERARIRADPALLARPLVVAVPSESLRAHLSARIAREVGAVAGIRVQSLFGLAADVLRRARRAPPAGAAFARVLARRAGEELEGGGARETWRAAVAAALTELHDAGWSPELEGALLEALDDAALGPAEARTAAGLLRAARRLDAVLAEHEVALAGATYRDAAAAVRAEPGALAARAVWLHGVADATGVLADFLDALARAAPLAVFWDDAAAAPRFGAALRERFGVPMAEDVPPSATPEAFRARGVDAEAREVACRLRLALDAGAVPESLAVVAHDLGPYRLALRTHLTRLGVPFSAAGARGPVTTGGRRWLAALDLVELGARAPIERWRAARADEEQDELAITVAFRALGTGRLAAAAGLDLDLVMGKAEVVPLPVRVASVVALDEDPDEDRDPREDEDGGGEDGDDAAADGALVERRTLARATLAAAVDEARTLAAAFAAWPQDGSAREHVAALRAVLDLLGLDGAGALAAAAESLAGEAPAGLLLARAEFLELLRPRVEDACFAPFGGAGGGVQVLTVTEARARTFERLFVLGLNAGTFPPAVREDPLLRDDARVALRRALPDLPLKRARGEEERALFDQLLRAAPAVTVSWLVADSDDEPRMASPLLDRAGIAEPEGVAVVGDELEPRTGVPQPAHEHAARAAHLGRRAGLERVLPLALRAGRRAAGLAAGDEDATARARAAALDELDRAPQEPGPLGPFFGFVGPRRGAEPDLFVTRIEGLGRCPWQTFLARRLRVKPPLDPLVGVPGLDPAVVGEVVHAVIADLAPRQGADLAAVAHEPGAEVAWPGDRELRAAARAHAERLLRQSGLAAPGLEHLVAARALELLAAAVAVDELDDGLRVVAAEVEGEVALADGRRVRFRADRLERSAAGLRLTDWKSGSVFRHAAKPETRRDRHVRAIARGAQLQGFVYALAAGEGRYVALAPSFGAAEARSFPVRADDAEARAAFDAATSTLLAAWDGGALFPRLLARSPRDENPACAHCELALACVRGDSGARLRFARFVQRDPATLAPEERLARAMWDLQVPAPRSAPAAGASAQAQRQRKPS